MSLAFVLSCLFCVVVYLCSRFYTILDMVSVTRDQRILIKGCIVADKNLKFAIESRDAEHWTNGA